MYILKQWNEYQEHRKALKFGGPQRLNKIVLYGKKSNSYGEVTKSGGHGPLVPTPMNTVLNTLHKGAFEGQNYKCKARSQNDLKLKNLISIGIVIA